MRTLPIRTRIEIVTEEGVQQVHGEKILIACGTRPAHIDGIPVDGKRIFDSDQVHCLEEIPRELIVVGAGIIGLEYASMFTALGVKVTRARSAPHAAGFCGSGDHREPVLPVAAIGDGISSWGKSSFGRLR